MRFYMLTTFLLAISTSWCFAQNKVPKEVQAIVDNYVKDSTVECGFLFAKKWLHLDCSIKSNEIRTGLPIQEVGVSYALLDTCEDTISFEKLLKPKDIWILPIHANGIYLYEVTISKASGRWKMSGTSELPSNNIWKRLKYNYPDSINPILVVDGLNKFLFFPQKGKRKVFYIRPCWENDSLAMIMSESLTDLDDSKKLVKYWKLIFHHLYGECIAASWTVNSSNFQSTWNIPNFVLPSGYQWRYNYDGKIPGKVEVVVEDTDGPPAHEDAINVLYRPSVLYPGTLVFENQVITNSQPDVEAHELIITRNDLFAPGGNISLKSGERIDITDGITVQNGSMVNFRIDPSLR